MLLKRKANRYRERERRGKRDRDSERRGEATHFSGNETPISLAAWPLAAERHQRGDLTVVDGEAGEGERVKEGAEKVEEEEEGTQQELTVTDDDQADRQTDIDLGLRNAAESGAVSAAAAFFGLSQSPPPLFPPLTLPHSCCLCLSPIYVFF